MTARCEPPKALRGVDGWHVVWRSDGPLTLFWDTLYWRQRASGTLITSYQLAGLGYRYGGPAPQPGAPMPAPDAVAALCKAARFLADNTYSISEEQTKAITALRTALARVEGETE